MSDTEVEMLRALADAAGLSSSDIVRTLVREAFTAKFGDKPPKKAKR